LLHSKLPLLVLQSEGSGQPAVVRLCFQGGSVASSLRAQVQEDFCVSGGLLQLLGEMEANSARLASSSDRRQQTSGTIPLID